ncbi:MAG: MiaB/RimO family radical SAM methylthiotransferase [bacterium]
MKHYYIQTYGCQMNKSDSERIVAILENAGCEECTSEKEADLIIVVACSVRQMAVDRVFGRAVKYEKLKKKNKNLKTVLTGCVLDIDKKKLEGKFDVICGIGEISKFLKNTCEKKKVSQGDNKKKKLRNKEIKKSGNNNYLKIKPAYQSKFQAYIPIMTGCNNFCSYCVVPYTRGREYSRLAEEILDEVKNLVEKGYKEIFLLGQNVNSYSAKNLSPSLNKMSKKFSSIILNAPASKCKGVKDPAVKQKNSGILRPPGARAQNDALFNPKEGKLNFPSLLRCINSISGDFWIRFATSHPKDMTDDLIDAIAECEKVCPYIHLPIQAGSDKILGAMNRKYTKEHYLKLIKKIKARIPDVMLSTDIIVGFPGERKKDFLETAGVFKKARYTMAYIAKYSPRAGTAAHGMDDNISHEEKVRREKVLNDILKKTALGNNKKFIGRIVRVLVEKETAGGYIGKIAQSINVKIKTKLHEKEYENTRIQGMVGQFAYVKITSADSWGMAGEILN